MQSRWLIWNIIPGLHWLAWIQAGSLSKYPWYYWIGIAYALPSLLFVISKPLSFRFILLSWVISLVHTQILKQEINRRIAEVGTSASVPEELSQALLQAALIHRGCLSVTQGVMETGKTFPEVEQTLNQMVDSVYVFIRNNPESGVVEYVFKELL